MDASSYSGADLHNSISGHKPQPVALQTHQQHYEIHGSQPTILETQRRLTLAHLMIASEHIRDHRSTAEEHRGSCTRDMATRDSQPRWNQTTERDTLVTDTMGTQHCEDPHKRPLVDGLILSWMIWRGSICLPPGTSITQIATRQRVCIRRGESVLISGYSVNVDLFSNVQRFVCNT